MYYTLVLMDRRTEIERVLCTARTDIQWIADKLNTLYQDSLGFSYFAVLRSRRFEDYGRDAIVAEVRAWLK
jgi:hypothetical protein